MHQVAGALGAQAVVRLELLVILRGLIASGMSVSWFTTTSGRASATARATPSASNASQTTASTPCARAASQARPSYRVIAVTSWPGLAQLRHERTADDAGPTDQNTRTPEIYAARAVISLAGPGLPKR